MTTSPPDIAPDHKRLLLLCRTARAAEKGPVWKTDLEEALEIHGDACDAFWAEAERQVEAYLHRDEKLSAPPSADEITKSIRKKLVRHLRLELPELLQAALESFEP